MKINKLPKWHSVIVKEVDPFTENLQIIGATIRDLRKLATKIGRLFGYSKGFESSGNWIKNERSITLK